MEGHLAPTLLAEAGRDRPQVEEALRLGRLEFRPPRDAVQSVRLATALGAVTLVAGLFLAPQRTWANLLLVGYFLLGLGLAGIFFVAVQYVGGAAWSTALRRVPEAMSAALPVGALVLGAVLVLRPSLYAWYAAAPGAIESLHGFKQAWLKLPFFLGRSAVYLLVWIAFATAIVRNSRLQDRDGDPAHTRRNVRLSAAFLAVFGATFWLASFDWVMSLEPDWYSTIFGIYNFAGLFLGGLATMVVLVVWLERRGPLRDIASEAHLHDLGKLLFAFSTFWMYIWFSQYMLIWYANIPEETSYFVRRMQGAWKPLFILDMLLNWGVPFTVLMHRSAKRSAKVLVDVALVIVAGRWLDLYLMILPPITGRPVFGAWEVGLMMGGAGLFMLVFFRAFAKAPAVPVGDPSLPDSLHAYQ